MSEAYHPASKFLRAVAAEEVPLSGTDQAEANFRRLIKMTRDEDRSNRDWATLLLSQHDNDTPRVRQALLDAARDEDASVRAEAMLGLAQRDKALALPFVIGALQAEEASMPVFEAAALIADPVLIDLLRPWTAPSDNEFLDQLACDALASCLQGISVGQSPD